MLATTGWTALHRPDHGGAPLAAALALWDRGSVDGRALPASDAPAAVIARFFGLLDPGQRARLGERYPLAVGNLDGVPVAVRYRANRLALGAARRSALRRAADYRLAPADREQAGRQAHRFTSLVAPGRQILAFDPTGSGRVAEVFGDLDQARRVSVIVPGVDTNLLTFERTARRYTAPVGMAESLYRAERAAAPGVPTAVIAWAGYTAPEGVGMDAATGRLAVEGAKRLGSLVGALPGQSPVALFCHSYGSVVCGVAARSLPRRVTDLGVAGSPGMRTGSAADLGTGARIWAMRDPGDWIADVPYLEVVGVGHGADPVSRGFGARRLSAGGAEGHTGYFEPGTVALDNFARIGTGSFGSVVCAEDDAACRRGISGTDGY
ncbi:alpha/beta hydrolase family protein [Streptomyces bambusae]|uniref:alpha/beta hydrolase n=1 Tax=Streptomyces bambusae TaxID=1550616 RepID=UPI001CFE1C1B|nr:alpha/beta hydrolase [Streptomyces bambusae]MCB5164880.1 alpha/beta hydrolase family protein [Streptomyces bambusae]